MRATARALDVDEVAELRAAVVALTARVAQLEAAQPRDAEDAALRRQLAISTRALPFRSQDLLRHGAVDAELRRALVAADCCDAAAIGVWLRAQRGVWDGVIVDRVGRQWRVHMVHMTCSEPIAQRL